MKKTTRKILALSLLRLFVCSLPRRLQVLLTLLLKGLSTMTGIW